MESEHTITVKDKWFLDKHMKDPIAQEPFKVGDTIVICAKCKTAQYNVSWGMNSNKCCSLGCDHDHILRFRAFSPAIFQPNMKYNSGFRVIKARMSFRSLAKIIDTFPMVVTAMALLPILVALFLFRSALQPAVSAIDGNKKLAVIQEKMTEIGENSYNKGIYSVQKILGLKPDFVNLEYRTDMPKPLLNDIAEKLEATDLSDKSHKIFLKMDSVFRRLKAVVSR